MDNGAYFIGDLIHSRHFIRVVRLCLYLSVEPMFIAPRKPWMNGTIEDNNYEFGEKLWEREHFKDLSIFEGRRKSFWSATTTARIGNIGRLIGNLYHSAEFMEILRSI